MEKEIKTLTKKVEEQKKKYDAYVKIEDEKREQMEKPYHLKIEFLEKLSQQIKVGLVKTLKMLTMSTHVSNHKKIIVCYRLLFIYVFFFY